MLFDLVSHTNKATGLIECGATAEHKICQSTCFLAFGVKRDQRRLIVGVRTMLTAHFFCRERRDLILNPTSSEQLKLTQLPTSANVTMASPYDGVTYAAQVSVLMSHTC